MTTEPLVTVVLPTYRRPQFIERAIESVSAQTLSRWELIIVDDNEPGSDERHATEAIVDGFSAEARLRYVRHDRNRGGAAARNSAIRVATAPYIAFLDDDDTWHPMKLERQLERIEAVPSESVLVYCRMRVVDVTTGRAYVRETDGGSPSARDLLMWNSIGSTSAVLCRAEALRSIGAFDETLPARQDQDLYVRMAQDNAFTFVDEVLVTVHVHDGPRISTDFNAAVEAHERFYDKHRVRIEGDREAARVLRHQYGKHLVAAKRFREARWPLVRAWCARPIDVAPLLRLGMTFGLLRVLVGPAKRFRALVRGERA